MTETVSQTVRNGVDTTTMFATLDAIKAQPELAQFRFRARNRWIDGAHNRSTIKDFYGAGAEDTSREQPVTLDAGEPPVLLGANTGPNPAEYLLHALAACVTISVVYVAAARGVRLTEVESTLEGDLDAQGAFGLSGDVRNGFQQIRMTIRVAGDAPADKTPGRSRSADTAPGPPAPDQSGPRRRRWSAPARAARTSYWTGRRVTSPAARRPRSTRWSVAEPTPVPPRRSAAKPSLRSRSGS
jgi:uncharacterized OsmC-like protein